VVGSSGHSTMLGDLRCVLIKMPLSAALRPSPVLGGLCCLHTTAVRNLLVSLQAPGVPRRVSCCCANAAALPRLSREVARVGRATARFLEAKGIWTLQPSQQGMLPTPTAGPDWQRIHTAWFVGQVGAFDVIDAAIARLHTARSKNTLRVWQLMRPSFFPQRNAFHSSSGNLRSQMPPKKATLTSLPHDLVLDIIRRAAPVVHDIEHL
jgi:hypothetical protein